MITTVFLGVIFLSGCSLFKASQTTNQSSDVLTTSNTPAPQVNSSGQISGAAPAPTSPKQSPAWVTIQSFSGSSDKNTVPFTVTSQHWRLRWKVNYGSPESGRFKISVLNNDGEPLATVSPANVADIKSMPFGSGIYVLQITSYDAVWQVTVEEQK